ncbi:transposon Ty3-I Gag-Pol polyprotein [Trichonephila clavipes]|nr:transposon Ty3-I Gag-Pol polyprotein [Trichonephila clavipes]
MYVDVEQKNWDEILPFVTFAYNTAKQETTGFTPFYLLHGREAETTLDTMLPFCPNDFDDNNITKIAARAEESRQLARVHTLRAQDKDRRRYDSKHQKVSYAPGDLVWVYTPELWFQQDGATCHTARATIDLLKDTFGDRLISRFGPVNWPPRSCDLTPLDYFLWGYVKSLVYADKPQTLHHLEDNIRRVIANIRPQMLEKVIENWASRLDYIRASRGSHMPEIIFKM